MNKSIVAAALLFLGAALGSGGVAAQNFPTKPVRVMIPFASGGPLEVMVRAIGEKFQESTGQPFVVEAKPGGGGIIAAQALMLAPPDGHTLLLTSSGMLTINPHAYSKLPYDTFRDFAHITGSGGAAMIFSAHSSTGVSNVKEWVAYAKANPGKTSFASFTAGNPSHFSGVILNELAGIDMLHIPYKGSAAAIQDLITGRVNTGFLPLSTVRAHLQTGTLKALATTGGKRNPQVPDVPTFVEQGYPKLEVLIWSGFAAPAGTPAPVLDRLNQELVKALGTQEVRDRMRTVDLDPMPMSQSQYLAFIREDLHRWEAAVKSSGFKAD